MAWESPLDPPGTSKAAFIDVCEWVYLWIFTFELLTKVVAYGFLMHKGSYLRDAWCQLDFVVVTLAWLPILFPSFGNYSVLRAFRALRPHHFDDSRGRGSSPSRSRSAARLLAGAPPSPAPAARRGRRRTTRLGVPKRRARRDTSQCGPGPQPRRRAAPTSSRRRARRRSRRRSPTTASRRSRCTPDFGS